MQIDNRPAWNFGHLTLIGFIAISAQAQEMESVLVTGTYAPLSELTASVSILEEEQIRLLNKKSLTDVLKSTPGLLVEEQGGAGGVSTVSIRGSEANFTLVLLDGVPVNDPTDSRGGGFDFGKLNPASVKRIEIVRGAQSAVYGSDALAGVINIITADADQSAEGELAGQWGEKEFADYSLGLRGTEGNWSYSIGVASRDAGEPVEGSTRTASHANMRVGWNPTVNHRFDLSYVYLDGDRSTYPEQSGGPELALKDDLDISDYRDDVFSLSWKAKVNELWSSLVAVDRFSHKDDYMSPGIFPYTEVPPNGAKTDFERDQLRWVNTIIIGPGTNVNLGTHYRKEEGQSNGYLEYFGSRIPAEYKLDRDTSGLFLNMSTSDLGAFLLQGSVRYDDPEGFDPETTLSVGARYHLNKAITFSTNWGEAFKLPSFAALGHPLVGNPDLIPETSENWDVSVDVAVGRDFGISLTAFFNSFENLVDFDNKTFQNVNRKNIETSGVELGGSWRAQPNLFINAQITLTDIDVKGEDTVLTGRPEWVASLTGQWQLTERWSTAVDYRYTGEQWAASRHTGEEEIRELNDFHRIDWGLLYSPSHQWQFQFSVENLFDEEYETAIGFPQPGREYRLGFRYGW